MIAANGPTVRSRITGEGVAAIVDDLADATPSMSMCIPGERAAERK